jgi:hypothetical protein
MHAVLHDYYEHSQTIDDPNSPPPTTTATPTVPIPGDEAGGGGNVNNKRYIYSVDPSLPIEDAVFFQWTHRMAPICTQFKNWISPNGKCSVEMITDIKSDALSMKAMEDSFRAGSEYMDKGTRIILFGSSTPGDENPCSQLLGDDTQGSLLGTSVRKLVHEWTLAYDEVWGPDPKHPPKSQDPPPQVIVSYTPRKREDREICLLSSSSVYGTVYKILPDTEDGYSVGITMIDTALKPSSVSGRILYTVP